MTDCIFCKIIQNEAPCYKIHETENILVVLALHPAAKGHMLVIPKEHYENVLDTPDEILGEINTICKQMGQLCIDKLGATGFNILNASGVDAQQSVFHLHYHVVPRNKNDGLDLWFHGQQDNQSSLEEVHNILK